MILASIKLPLLISLMCLFVIACIVFLIIETYKIKIVSYEIKKGKVSKQISDEKGLNIVFFSDIHIGKHLKKKQLDKRLKMLLDQNADLYIFGGDLIGKNINKYYSIDDVSKAFSIFKDKTCIAIYGNHEYKIEKGIDSKLKDDYFKAMNFVVLNNTSYLFKKDDLQLEIYGMNDYIYHEAKLPDKQYDLVVCHEADIIDKMDNQIMLSGHTHGGQIKIPLIPLYYKPINGKKYFKGYYQTLNNQLIISNGLGFEFMKIRFNAPADIIKIKYIK